MSYSQLQSFTTHWVFRRWVMLMLGFFIVSFIHQDKKPVRVWLIGDSTLCVYPVDRAPLTGWGMPFAVFFGG